MPNNKPRHQQQPQVIQYQVVPPTPIPQMQPLQPLPQPMPQQMQPMQHGYMAPVGNYVDANFTPIASRTRTRGTGRGRGDKEKGKGKSNGDGKNLKKNGKRIRDKTPKKASKPKETAKKYRNKDGSGSTVYTDVDEQIIDAVEKCVERKLHTNKTVDDMTDQPATKTPVNLNIGAFQEFLPEKDHRLRYKAALKRFNADAQIKLLCANAAPMKEFHNLKNNLDL